MLWVVAIQIIRLLDKYHSTYLLKETHIIFRRSSAVPHANEHARDVPGMKLCSATTLIQLNYRIWHVVGQNQIQGTSWACSFAQGTALECLKII